MISRETILETALVSRENEIKELLSAVESLREENVKLREALKYAKESIAYVETNVQEINFQVHGDLHGCDCDGGCNCKPKLWCDLENLKYHCMGAEIGIAELEQLKANQKE